jgi:hypothetical protein
VGVAVNCGSRVVVRAGWMWYWTGRRTGWSRMVLVLVVFAAVRSRSGQAVVSKFSTKSKSPGVVLAWLAWASASSGSSSGCWLLLSLSLLTAVSAATLLAAAATLFIEGRPERLLVRQCLSISTRLFCYRFCFHARAESHADY